jgi:curli biogenesis system outer membrane secretion channel CsgG
VPTLVGAAVRDNRTPMDGALSCFGAELRSAATRPPVIAVGDVRDYTGKYSVNEGNAITQGGALMVYSALGKLGGAVTLAERFDPTIAERELGYTDRRQLGDGAVHDVAGTAGAAVSRVPWLPYYGGSIAASDYFIVGGITELNYDIRSGGIDVAVSQLGPKVRTYTESVAIDLRIVDTRSLVVVRTISLTKQFTGYEVGFNLFRFFGSNLFDVDAGAKGQEPLQLGVRTALEEATLRLVGAVTQRNPAPCLARSALDALGKPASVIAMAATGGAGAAFLPSHGHVINDLAAAGSATGNAAMSVPFEFASASPAATDAGLFGRIVTEATKGRVDVVLIAHDTETLDPAKRDALTDRRVASVTSVLRARGFRGTVQTTWRADPAGPAVRSAAPGFQDVARLRVGG